ncbi:hypothetical protein F5Y07DRAFT_379271 [Xylaria sp. FL0933]|nr:hypothetical protein F5Y07DRAFT_379271 [Xylaria sp. FL0933]
MSNFEDIRDKDIHHFWYLACFWEDKFGTEDVRNNNVVETRGGQEWLDKKRVSDWVMGLETSLCPMILRAGRKTEIPPSPPESARKRKRSAQDKPQESKSPKRKQSGST